MHRLKEMKNCLVNCVQAQLGDLRNADTHELGEAIDMIKDLEEAMYYCSIVKAMEKADEEEEMLLKLAKKEGRELTHEEKIRCNHHYMPIMFYPYPEYPPMMYYGGDGSKFPYGQMRDIDRDMGRMYYDGNKNNYNMYYDGKYYNGNGNSNSSSQGNSSNGGNRQYHERELPFDMMNMRDQREGRAPMTRRMYMESKEMHKDQQHKMKELEKYMQDLSQDIVEMIEDASPEEKKILEKKMTLLASKVSQLNA